MEDEVSSQDRVRNASLAEQGRALADGTWQRGTGALHDLSCYSLPQLHIQRKTHVWRLPSSYQATEPKQGARPDSSSYLWLAGCFRTFWSRRWAGGGRTAPLCQLLLSPGPEGQARGRAAPGPTVAHGMRQATGSRGCFGGGHGGRGIPWGLPLKPFRKTFHGWSRKEATPPSSHAHPGSPPRFWDWR